MRREGGENEHGRVIPIESNLASGARSELREDVWTSLRAAGLESSPPTIRAALDFCKREGLAGAHQLAGR